VLQVARHGWCVCACAVDTVIVAEDLIYGHDHVSTGASNDFQQATRLAQHMVAQWGMSDGVGFVYYENPDEVEEVQKEVRACMCACVCV
jgi:ATP-dependent Zn protease